MATQAINLQRVWTRLAPSQIHSSATEPNPPHLLTPPAPPHHHQSCHRPDRGGLGGFFPLFRIFPEPADPSVFPRSARFLLFLVSRRRSRFSRRRSNFQLRHNRVAGRPDAGDRPELETSPGAGGAQVAAAQTSPRPGELWPIPVAGGRGLSLSSGSRGDGAGP